MVFRFLDKRDPVDCRIIELIGNKELKVDLVELKS